MHGHCRLRSLTPKMVTHRAPVSIYSICSHKSGNIVDRIQRLAEAT